ncbi:hypothetical protein FQN57_001844 [Myotisia sp. PD_48]|nr:hypothetical protein FQN57_001844 [Myotisia sp. PD_48]
MSLTGCTDEDFGPTSCQRFDFTLLFEQSILSTLPCALLLLLGPLRLYWLYNSSIKVQPHGMQNAKMVATLAFVGLQLALVIAWSLRIYTHIRTQISVTSSAISFANAVLISILSFLEHQRSYQSSSLLLVYLLMSSIFDSVQLRTLWLMKVPLIATLLSLSLASKTLLFLLESYTKAGYIKEPFRSYSSESRASIITWSFLWWLNRLLLTGFRKVLTYDDLSTVHENIDSRTLEKRMETAWEKRGKPESCYALPIAAAYCFFPDWLITVAPRLALVGFNYAQPFLITRAITLLKAPDAQASIQSGYGLIVATFIIYFGRAIATVHYRQRVCRIIAMFRGAMVTLIYNRTLYLQGGMESESAALTLMSTDIDNIVDSLEPINEIWGSAIEIIIGIWLLQRQLGAICVVPIFLTLVTKPAERFMAAVPHAAACMTCFTRIQTYLLLPSMIDRRVTLMPRGLPSETTSSGGSGIELNSMSPLSQKDVEHAVIFSDASLCPAPGTQPVLSNVTFSILKSSLVIVIGPIGSGKTTLAKAILGELTCERGSVSVATNEISYCHQTPWLVNRSVLQSVCGLSMDTAIDERWYRKVIWACCLDPDIKLLPEGDHSIIGNNGLTLSGGQKQRLALARAVYSRKETIVLDDVFSAQDAKTENAVFDRLLGKQGLLKKIGATIVLITHSARHLPFADKLVILKDGLVDRIGSYSEIMHSSTIPFDSMLSRLPHSPGDVAEFSVGPSNRKQESTAIMLEEEADNATRRIGDTEVYKYYSMLIGWKYSALFILANIGYAFSITFPAALIFAGSSYMAITAPVAVLSLYLIQNVYLKTSRQLRHMDLEAKSPIYSHFLETLEGLSTIRAFGWQQSARNINLHRLDISQKPYYLLFSIQRWLNLVLDLLVAALATILVSLAFFLRHTSSPELLGVALTTVLLFNETLSKLIAAWTSLETSLGAIARVKAFAETTPVERKAGEEIIPPEEWPQKGEILFNSMSAAHDDANTVLHNITFRINPGEKIGICGRTGSGKSSLIYSILRLIEISTGDINIDGVDISTIPRHLIRSRIITIPQDRFVLTGSIRRNADPSGMMSGESIQGALEKVHLWRLVESRGGLDTNMENNLFSSGQQQLFRLARAILIKENRTILILDEATSNVDAATDSLMQSVIQDIFEDFTIITIAHRLDTIMSSDKIAVLDQGKLVEFDSPINLRTRNGSAFNTLYNATFRSPQ